jgi:hypothetical protein
MPYGRANECTHPRKSAEGTASVVPSKRALRRPEASAPRRKTTGSVSTIERFDLSAMCSLRARAQSFRPGVGEERDGSKKTSTIEDRRSRGRRSSRSLGPGGAWAEWDRRLNVRSATRLPTSMAGGAQASWRPGERVVGGERAALDRRSASSGRGSSTEVSAPSRFVSDALRSLRTRMSVCSSAFLTLSRQGMDSLYIHA